MGERMKVSLLVPNKIVTLPTTELHLLSKVSQGQSTSSPTF